MKFDITFILASPEMNHLCSAVIAAETWADALTEIMGLVAKNNGQLVSIARRDVVFRGKPMSI